MPLYEYKCRDCSHLFERRHSYRARAPRCPECGASTERQLSAPAIQFKGTGFYITDYARKEKGGAKSDTGKADEKSDTGKAGEKSATGKAGEKSSDTGKAGENGSGTAQAKSGEADKKGSSSSAGPGKKGSSSSGGS